ncbi:PAR1 protein [Forsythia ovata]|uniref:PAR1 protein n=1 Tax=Forsythia ovata TaxID=205694 RepID=A0ABD1T6I2_9LAMI
MQENPTSLHSQHHQARRKSTFPKQKSSFCTKMKMIIFLAFALFLQGSLGELVCEELPVGLCSFSIASSGKRCLLETFASNDGTLEFQCKTSEVVAINLHEYIEADECVSACGVDRKSIGISSDSLLDSQSTPKLCSPQCYQNCPNIVDLYYNLALGEGELDNNPTPTAWEILSYK